MGSLELWLFKMPTQSIVRTRNYSKSNKSSYIVITSYYITSYYKLLYCNNKYIDFNEKNKKNKNKESYVYNPYNESFESNEYDQYNQYEPYRQRYGAFPW